MTSRFELLEQIGRGGMGVVWKARDTETGDIVALKLLRESYADDPDYIARFEREVETAQRIDSPHVVKVLGHGVREGIPFIAMEYVEGQSLRERLRAQGPLTWPEAAELTRQLLLGLDAAHRAKVLHRDIKPGNILLTASGTAKLADFGIARALDLDRLTGSATMLGTPAYMAPDGTEDERSDLYSLGCVVYEMLAGAPPFEGSSVQSVLAAHFRQPPDLAKVPLEARTFVGSLMDKDAVARPLSAGAAMALIPEGVVGEGERKPSRETLLAISASRTGFFKRSRIAVMAGVVVPLLGAFGAFMAVNAGGSGGEVLSGGGSESPTAITSRTPTVAPSFTATATATATDTPTSTLISTAEPTATETPTFVPTETLGPTSTRVPPTATARTASTFTLEAPSPTPVPSTPTASPPRAVIDNCAIVAESASSVKMKCSGTSNASGQLVPRAPNASFAGTLQIPNIIVSGGSDAFEGHVCWLLGVGGVFGAAEFVVDFKSWSGNVLSTFVVAHNKSSEYVPGVEIACW